MQKGFTLIELLVVVLIIGILSAVALPQYQKSVMKSKIMRDTVLLRSLLDAQKVYQLANGEFSISFAALDLGFNCERTETEGTSEYCYLSNKLLLKLWGPGVYAERGGEYRLSYDPVTHNVLCVPWSNNSVAKSTCKSLGAQQGDETGYPETFKETYLLFNYQ